MNMIKSAVLSGIHPLKTQTAHQFSFFHFIEAMYVSVSLPVFFQHRKYISCVFFNFPSFFFYFRAQPCNRYLLLSVILDARTIATGFKIFSNILILLCQGMSNVYLGATTQLAISDFNFFLYIWDTATTTQDLSNGATAGVIKDI